jgi:hypothetical protein
MRQNRNSISLDSPIDVAAQAVPQALADQMRALNERKPQLRIEFSDLGAPLDGAIVVPVQALATANPAGDFALEITAAGNKRLYPVFSGTLALVSMDKMKCALRLEGTYDAPLGMLGFAIDATLLAGAARTSLQRFLDDLAKTVVERVRRNEARYAESRRFR